MEIVSTNDFLPNEATKELTEENISIQDTILPLTKNDSICTVKNLGYTETEILSVLRETGSADLSFEDRLKKALSLLTPLR